MLNTPPNQTQASADPASQLSPEQVDALIAQRLAQLKASNAGSPTGDTTGETTDQQTKSQTPFQAIKHGLVFSGSGSEYFRIWIVNVLLTIVTLTLYAPWAKVRKLQYFYRNTTLDAQPFDYHANPWALFKGRLVALALLGAYYASDFFGFAATLAISALLLAIGPWLMWRSLQFKLANSSYRAVRFGFTGDLKGAYWVFGISIFAALAYAIGLSVLAQDMAQAAANGKVPSTSNYMAIFGLLPFIFPIWHWALKKYQHGHYSWASLDSTFSAGKSNFYKAWLKYALLIMGIGFMFTCIVIIFSFLGFSGIFAVFKENAVFTGTQILSALLFLAPLVVAYALFLALLQAYLSSRFQNLVWNNTQVKSKTASSALQFNSDLQLWPLTKIMMWNLFLTAITLGLYWPFAAIKLAKIRLESVSVTQNLPWASIAPSLAGNHANGATGAEVQDVFDIDFAL